MNDHFHKKDTKVLIPQEENHNATKPKVKEFVAYVLGLDPNTLKQPKKLKLGMLKLSNEIKEKSINITDEDAESFFSVVSFMMDILSSYDKKKEAVECYQELQSEFELESDFDKIVDGFLNFYKTEAGLDLRSYIGERNARKMVDSVLGNDNENKNNKNKEKQTKLFDANTNVINTNEDKVNALKKRYKGLSKFNDESKYKQLDLSALNLLLLDMEKYIIDAIRWEMSNSEFEKIQGVIQLHHKVSVFFSETALSNVNKLLVEGHQSCRLLDNNINDISKKISDLGEGKLTNKNEYQAKIKFLEQKINVNIRGGSLFSARIRGLHSVIGSDISDKLQNVSDKFCYKNDESLAAILKIKQCRNLFINEMSKIISFRQKMSLQVIEELKKISENLDQICDNQELKQELSRLEGLPKTVNVEHSIKTGFWWWLYKFLNFFTRGKQIAPQNSLNTQISTVVHQRFDQFKKKDFIVPLNSLIIRSLGIEPDLENFETERLFECVFQNILKPMLENDMEKQLGSLADALYNVIPQDQTEDSFKGVQYAISQYVGDAMIKCWVEAIFDFIRTDSASDPRHLCRRDHIFDADMYFDNLKDNKDRKDELKKILDGRFLECRSNIVTNIEKAIKDGNNDHKICEDLLKLDTELLDFCNELHNRNLGQLGAYIPDCINRMTSAEKDTLSRLQLNLKFSIFNCRSENEDKALEKPNNNFLNNFLPSQNKTEYEDAVASKKDFLNNLSPSSKTAYAQSEALAGESADALEPEKEGKENMIHNQIKELNVENLKFPKAYNGLLSDTNGSKPEMKDGNKHSLFN